VIVLPYVGHVHFDTIYFLYLVKHKEQRQRTYKRNIEARSRNHCCRGKVISITYSDRVSVALVIQHAKRLWRVILLSVSCLPYFYTLSHKWHDFRKNVIEHETCFDFLYNVCPNHFSF
jgi:hypothetical protein